MRVRLLTGIVILTLSTLTAGASLAGEARPLDAATMADAPATAALFHPDSAESLAVLDNMRDAGNHGVLAVCVGVGCSADRADELAQERGWGFPLAYDVSGEQASRLLGTSKVPDVVRIPTSSAAAPSRMAAAAKAASPSGLVAGLSGIGGGGAAGQQGRGKLAGALTSDGSGPSLVQLVLLSIPVALLGLGVGVIYLGTRRKESAADEERDESALLAQHIRERHGRKSARRPSTA